MKRKGHHFITESYQRGFTDENQHVWILTPEKTLLNTNPTNSFKEDHFYTIKLPTGGGSLVVEKTLAQIEGGFIGVIKNKVQQKEDLTEEDRMYISLFVAAMFTRTKVQRNHFKQQMTNMIERMEEMKEAMIKNPPKSPFPMERGSGPSVSLEEMKEHMNTFDSDEALTTLTLLQDTAPAIAGMKWSIFSPEKSAGTFLCSDNPLCMCSPEREAKYGRSAIGASAGLASGDVEITFPLTKTHALFASWDNPLPLYVDITSSMVEQINIRTSRTASNLIASSKEQLEAILERLQKHHP